MTTFLRSTSIHTEVRTLFFLFNNSSTLGRGISGGNSDNIDYLALDHSQTFRKHRSQRHCGRMDFWPTPRSGPRRKHAPDPLGHCKLLSAPPSVKTRLTRDCNIPSLLRFSHPWCALGGQWITEADFADIAAAGLNHVRLPIGYWAWDISGGT